MLCCLDVHYGGETAAGMGYDVAARHIASMAGKHRIPDPIKAADRLARGRA